MEWWISRGWGWNLELGTWNLEVVLCSELPWSLCDNASVSWNGMNGFNNATMQKSQRVLTPWWMKSQEPGVMGWKLLLLFHFHRWVLILNLTDFHFSYWVCASFVILSLWVAISACNCKFICYLYMLRLMSECVYLMINCHSYFVGVPFLSRISCFLAANWASLRGILGFHSK